MNLEPVSSTNIKATGHDPETGEMRIAFHDKDCPVRSGEACGCVGRVYGYAEVPAEHHEGLRGADSIGSYFHTHIRKNFTGVLIEPEKTPA